MSEAYAKALDLLARRPHFQAELAGKLSKRGFAEDECEEALERLRDQGWLDDAKLAHELVGGLFRRKGFGPRRMRAELLRRGVDASEVDGALGTPSWSDEMDWAREVASRYHGSRREGLARHLDRKGYSAGVIVDLLEEWSGGTESSSHREESA